MAKWWIFHLRRLPPKKKARRMKIKKGNWAFLSEEFGSKHPDFVGQFWAVFGFTFIMVVMHGALFLGAIADRNYHQRLRNVTVVYFV